MGGTEVGDPGAQGSINEVSQLIRTEEGIAVRLVFVFFLRNQNCWAKLGSHPIKL